MAQFKSYSSFQSHEHSFNTGLRVGAAVAFSLMVIEILVKLGFFGSFGSYCTLWVLIASPAILFITCLLETEDCIAYYRTWHDYIRGFLDQKKILQQFAKQYNISTWRTHIEHIKPDGRWNFHAHTKYINNLTTQRDLLMSQILEDYQNLMTILNQRVIVQKRELQHAKNDLAIAQERHDNTQALLRLAKSSGEVYVQRHNLEICLEEIRNCKNEINRCEHEIKRSIESISHLEDDYKEVVRRTTKLFQRRYDHYTEYAVRKINRVNGLKWDISDMPDNYVWLQPVVRKETL